ncbi:hypothetical protein BKA83DRAFT_4286646 [Pisolithus microcarpus]|nr:hypothetical protein BKA83DRAFT_4286646 [Pisolithus microcarpus]
MDIPGGFGSTLIGGLISAILYGIGILQTYTYYMHYPDDALAIRFLVACVWILDTLHFSFMCHFLYYYLVTNYENPTSFLYTVWSLQASVLVHAIMITTVQCFFVHQIYHLCRPQVKWWVTVPIMLFVLAATGLGMASGILELLDEESSLVIQTSFQIATPALSILILAEILIAMSLCTLLYDGSSRSTFPRTKRLLNTLLIYAVNRCLLTLLGTIAELAVNVNRESTWTTALDFIGKGLYSNSLLASLNARQYLRIQDSSTVSDPCISTVDFAKRSKLQEYVESSEDGTGRLRVSEEAVIDITADPSLDEMTAGGREAEV